MNWTTASLGEITTVLNGTTPDSSNPAYWNGNYVWVTPTDLGKLQEQIIFSSSRLITDKGRDSCNLPLVPAGSVVMSSRAPIGHIAIAGCDLHTNQGCKSFVCGNEINPEFLYFTLKHRMPEIQALGSGATFTEVSKSTLEDFKISFPSIEKQRQIAARLKAQLAEVDKARQAAEKQLRDAVVLKTKVLNTLFYKIENRVPIGSVTKVQSGFAFKSKEFQTSGVRLLRNANILPGKVYWEDAVFLKEKDAEDYPAYLLNDGDVLISLDRPLISSGIKVARVGANDLPALLVQRVGRFQLNEKKLDAGYLYAFLQTDMFISAISGHDQSLGVPHISPTQIEKIHIPLVSLAEQRQLEKKLDEVAKNFKTLQSAIKSQIHDITLLPRKILAQAFGDFQP